MISKQIYESGPHDFANSNLDPKNLQPKKQCCGFGMIYSGSGSNYEFLEFRNRIQIFFFCIYFCWPQVEVFPSSLRFYSITQWSCSAPDLTILFKSILEIMKGKVSREWGGLQMILLDRLEVFNFPRHGYFYSCRRFHKEFLKMAAWAVLHT